MTTIYSLLVFLHVLAAATWIGGMLFVALIVVPLMLRKDTNGRPAGALTLSVRRFRWVAWSAFLILVTTGTGLLGFRFRPVELLTASTWDTTFGRILAIKLVLVLVVLLLSATHDFVIGPRAAAQRRRGSSTLIPLVRWMSRANMLASLAILALATMLIRGWPR